MIHQVIGALTTGITTWRYSAVAPYDVYSLVGATGYINVLWYDNVTIVTGAASTGTDGRGRYYYETGGYRYTADSANQSEPSAGNYFRAVARTPAGVMPWGNY